jgi:FAD:protein FMN transferase
VTPTLTPIRRRTAILMDTLVAIEVVTDAAEEAVAPTIERAFDWFRRVEEVCTRFDPDSEVMRLAMKVGTPVPVSPILFETARFALAVARASHGAFDPTIGQELASRGFDRNYRTGERVAARTAERATYHDVRLDSRRQTITLRRPLVLDLGAVAKGFAIDLAARELGGFADFSIDAGGDLYVRGKNPAGEPWRVGIRHPLQPGVLADVLRVSDVAVCTSGDYDRRAPSAEAGHHILDPRSGASPEAVASVTVVAPTAMVADALGTAAFVLGPKSGREFLERQDVQGMIVTGDLERFETPGFALCR